MPVLIALLAVVALVSGAWYYFQNSDTQITPEPPALTENVTPTTTSPVTTVSEPTPTPSVAQETTPATPPSTNNPTPTPTTKPTTSTTPAPTTPATQTTPAPEKPTTPAPVTPAAPAPVTRTLTTAVSYNTPAPGEESIAVTMTVKDGVVTSVSTIYNDGDPNGYQDRFDAKYKTYVIGKTLDSISLSRVGGASLTSKAFNVAVDKLQSQV